MNFTINKLETSNKFALKESELRVKEFLKEKKKKINEISPNKNVTKLNLSDSYFVFIYLLFLLIFITINYLWN